MAGDDSIRVTGTYLLPDWYLAELPLVAGSRLLLLLLGRESWHFRRLRRVHFVCQFGFAFYLIHAFIPTRLYYEDVSYTQSC